MRYATSSFKRALGDLNLRFPLPHILPSSKDWEENSTLSFVNQWLSCVMIPGARSEACA